MNRCIGMPLKPQPEHSPEELAYFAALHAGQATAPRPVEKTRESYSFRQKPMTEQQERLLTYIRTHGPSTAHGIKAALGIEGYRPAFHLARINRLHNRVYSVPGRSGRHSEYKLPTQTFGPLPEGAKLCKSCQ